MYIDYDKKLENHLRAKSHHHYVTAKFPDVSPTCLNAPLVLMTLSSSSKAKE